MKLVRSLVAFLCCAALSSAGAAHAQLQPSAQGESRALSDLMANFYTDPEPEKLERTLREWPKTSSEKSWQAYPPLAGFLAVALPLYPDRLDRFMPAEVDPQMGETLTAAARLSGDAKLAGRIEQKLRTVASHPKLRAEFAALPSRVADLRVSSATHLDILWGAAFASGDARFVRPIVAFAAATANRSEPIALDVARVALAMSGGPTDVYKEIKPKYGDQVGREIIFASTALWALGSNARRHEFVKKALAAEAKNRVGTPASKALAAFLPRPAAAR